MKKGGCGCGGISSSSATPSRAGVEPATLRKSKTLSPTESRSPVETASELAARMTTWRAYAENPNHNPCAARTPGKRWKGTLDEKICDVGDMVLFNALLGASGEASAIDAVRRSQDNSGRWWRSPMHVDESGNPTNYPGSRYSFSKDHTLGVLLYFVTTPDREMARGQAKAWLHYMRKQGRIWDKLRIGPDIPEPIGYKIAKSLAKCVDGLQADGCAVRETITTVKEVWEKVRDCVLNPGDCWAKVRKEVQEDIDREIGYWTHNVCPEASLATCTISPGLWFLFHRVWRDHLGLAPSASMRFADTMFSDSSYDEFVAWEAGGEHGTPHLAAVNGMIRAILGKPASHTITTVYQLNSENPFYQYLMHKYVNNNLHPTEQIRSHLLAISPSNVEEYDKTEGGRSFKWFRNEDGADNSGSQWAWERDNVREAVRDTMGWDCIFIGNLLVREFQVELDYYVHNVLPDLLRDRKRVLNEALSRLAESCGAVQRVEAGLDEFVEKSVAVITHPDVTFAELEHLNRSVLERHGSTCPLSLQRLYDDHSAARAGYESLLRLKEESRRKYQDAERLAEFGELWGPQMTPYADTENLLRDVRERLEGKTACLKLVQLLVAIPLRIEQEKISGTNQSLREVEDQIVADLKAVAKDLEYDRIKTELNWVSFQLAAPLRQNRIRRRYNRGTETAEELGEQFQVAFGRITSGASLLTADDLTDLRHDAVQLIESEQREWDGFVAEFGLKQIIAGRLEVLNARARRHFEQVQGYPQGHQRALYFQWRLRAEEAGYRPTQECRNAGTNAYQQLSCWQFRGPADLAPRDEWVLFDLVLDGIEQLITDFASVGRPTDLERAAVPESAQLPATGILFDVQAEGTCSERVQTPDGVRFRGCRIPSRMEFRAAAVSASGGNAVVESLTFFNRLVILANGESLAPASVTVKLDGRRIADQALQVGGRVDVDLPVPYAGAMVELAGTELNEWNVFKPGTKVEVQINYVYPDVRALKAYGSVLGKYTKFVARVHRDLAPGAEQTEVIASLDEGVELLALLLDRDDLDSITRRQIETARTRMAEGKSSITQACSTGGPELCSAQIRTVRESLSANIEAAANELSSLREFLSAEIQRLTGIADDIQRQLQAILDDLAPPESIRGVRPFLVWIPRNSKLELTSDEQSRFIRGEMITLTFEGFDSAFRSPSYWGANNGWAYIGDVSAQGGKVEWSNLVCGEKRYLGIHGDFGSQGRPSGPLFSNERCVPEEKNCMRFGFQRKILVASRLREFQSANRPLVIRANVEYSGRPGHSRWVPGLLERNRLGIAHGMRLYFWGGGSNGFESARRQEEYFDNTSWRANEFSIDANINNWSQYFVGGDDQSGGLVLVIDINCREIQINRIQWQLLTPF